MEEVASSSKRGRDELKRVKKEPIEESEQNKMLNEQPETKKIKAEENIKDYNEDISYAAITNDGSDEDMIRLITLKNIFGKQLPKMPKEYIVRLVLDRRHHSICLLKGGVAIGGICYRPYFEQHFAEIAFCAVTGSEQVKGFGTHLMNQLKQHVKRQGITHLLTYADNYAIGYFKKQGFSSSLLMPRERWYGYIKDYDGGTLMECYIHPTIDFEHVPDMLRLQKEFILSRIKQVSRSEVVYPGLAVFKGASGIAVKSEVSPKCEDDEPHGSDMTKATATFEIPGMVEAGWGKFSEYGATKVREDEWKQMVGSMTAKLREVQRHSSSWPFRAPVDIREVPDYVDVVKDPIDLTLIKGRLTSGYYKSEEMMLFDLKRMMDNCRLYNGKSTVFYKEADTLQAFVEKLFAK